MSTSTCQDKTKKVRIRRQLVIPNLLKNYFVLTLDSSNDLPATHQDDISSKPDCQYSVYRVCGDDNEQGSQSTMDASKRASVVAKRADVKKPVKRNSLKNSSLEFVNTSYSPDGISTINTGSGITKTKKMRTLSPELSSNTSTNRHSTDLRTGTMASISETCSVDHKPSNNNNSREACISSPSFFDGSSNISETGHPIHPSHIHLPCNIIHNNYTLTCTPILPSTYQSSTCSIQTYPHCYQRNTSLPPHLNNNLFLQLNALEIQEEWDKLVLLSELHFVPDVGNYSSIYHQNC